MKKPKLASLLALVPQSKARKPMNKLQAHANRLTHSAYDDYEEPTTKLSTAFVVVLALHVVAVAGIYAFHSIKAKRREADGTAVAAKTVAPVPAVAAASAVPPVTQKTAAAPASAAPVATAPAPAAPSASGAQKTSGLGATAKTENAASHLPAPSGPSAVIPAQKTPAQPAQTAQTAPPRTPASNTAGTSVAAKAQPPAVTPIKAVAVVPAVQPVAAVVSAQKTYTVAKGDNPVAIAKRMNVSYEEMLKLNKIDDPKKLQIGQTLKMPAAKQSH